MLTELQKSTAQAIINIFETSRVRGDYGKVTLLAGDTGHLTYGRAQTTLGSGNLFLLIKDYVKQQGAAFSAALKPFLPRLEGRDVLLDHDVLFKDLLRDAGGDPIMMTTQDAFFDRVYWRPATISADFIGAKSPLGTAVVYDGRVHGSWHALRDRTIERHGRLNDIGEEDWIGKYVAVRRDWLATHSNVGLHATVYRMDSFSDLISANKWKLPLPLRVRGIAIRKELLEGPPPVRISAESPAERLLKLESPFLVGDDVEQVQLALVDAGLSVDTDGIFGPNTEAAVRRFQQKEDMIDDGIVGAATRAALGL